MMSTTPIPKGFIAGGYNEAVAWMISAFSDYRIVEFPGDFVLSVLSPLKLDLTCSGKGVRGHWMNLLGAWDTTDLKGCLESFRRAVRERRLYCDPFMPCASCLCLLNSLFTLVEYSSRCHVQVLCRLKVFHQSFEDGCPLPGQWEEAAENAPTLRFQIEMNPAFFPDEEFELQKLTKSLPYQKESVQSVFENAAQELLIQMQAADRL